MTQLFTPIQLGGLTLPNRIVVAPMCQYSADDGSMSDWHFAHLGSLAISGAGLLVIEATAVTRHGRISHGCTGLYTDRNEAAIKRVVDHCRRLTRNPIGIQLAHAGRKASTHVPWEGRSALGPDEDPWDTVSSSALPYDTRPPWHTPHAASTDEIKAIVEAFGKATARALRLGLDAVELHAAHGYLLHQFLTPLINKRTDRYGGSRENRMRFPLEVFEAVRAIWPARKPLGIRISAVDWLPGGWDIDDSVAFVQALRAAHCDFVDVSSGGVDPTAKIPVGPGYQVPFAERIKHETGMATMAVGMITDADQAEAILADGRADMVSIARAFLDDPHWGWHAAYKLGALPEYPPQYARSGLKAWAPAERHAAKR